MHSEAGDADMGDFCFAFEDIDGVDGLEPAVEEE